MSTATALRNTEANIDIYRCFPHVINLAVQAIFTGMKSDPCAIFRDEWKPSGMTDKEIEQYAHVLAADIVGVIRKTVAACRASGQRREEFRRTIIAGNREGLWKDMSGNLLELDILQLLCDCETRWSSTFLMLDQAIGLYPVSHASCLLIID